MLINRLLWPFILQKTLCLFIGGVRMKWVWGDVKGQRWGKVGVSVLHQSCPATSDERGSWKLVWQQSTFDAGGTGVHFLLFPSSTGTLPYARHAVPNQWVPVPDLVTSQTHVDCSLAVLFVSTAHIKDCHPDLSSSSLHVSNCHSAACARRPYYTYLLVHVLHEH